MTFSTIKAAGWTDNLESASAAELNALDTNQALAVDGSRGGSWAPGSTLQIDGSGFGSNALRDITVSGILTRTSTGRWVWRTSTSTITNIEATPQVVDMKYDTYRLGVAQTANIVVHLAVTTGQTPTTGDMIQVVRDGIPGVAKTFKIYSEESPAPAPPVAEFPSAVGGSQSNEIYMAEFWFNGVTWKPMRLSCDVTG